MRSRSLIGLSPAFEPVNETRRRELRLETGSSVT